MAGILRPPRSSCLGIVVGSASFFVLCVAPPASAIDGASCPSKSLCAVVTGVHEPAVPAGQDVITATDPTSPTSVWTRVHVDSAHLGGERGELTSVACPSTTLCVAVDQLGNAFVSTQPAGGAKHWRTVHLDTGPRPQHVTPAFNDVACIPPSFCFTSDTVGNLFTSTNPVGGATTWMLMSGFIEAASCPTKFFCLAIISGNLATSADPTSPERTWVPVGIDTTEGLYQPYCKSPSLCIVSGTSGNVAISTNPTGGAAAWSIVHIDKNTQYLQGPSCASITLCVVGDLDGNILSGDPSAIPSAWHSTHIDNEPIRDVSCPTASFCIAVDDRGHVFISRNPAGGAGTWRGVQIVTAR